MATTYIYDHRVDVTEALVLGGLARTYNSSASGQGDIVIMCKEIFDRESLSRKRFNKLYRYYNDDQIALFIKDVFKPLLGKDPNGEYIYDKMCRENVTPLVKVSNYIKRFVDKQATLYDDPPAREVTGDTKATEEYNRLAKDINLDAILQMAERYQKLFGSSFMRPVVRDIGGEQYLDVDLMLPTFFYAIPYPGDTTRASGYFWLVYDLAKPDDPMKATWYYIDSGNYFWWKWDQSAALVGTASSQMSAVISENYKDQDDIESAEGNNLGETGILRLASSWVCGDVIPKPGDSLINFQENVNLTETMKLNSLIFQAFPILHLHNFDIKDKDGRPLKLNVGPWSTLITSSMAGDGEAKVNWVAPQANIDTFIKSLQHDIDTFLLTQGVPKNLILDSATSGTALAERNRDINEIRKSYVNQYADMEQELYRVIAKWCAKWFPEYKLPEDGELVVKYSEVEKVETEQVTAEFWEAQAWEKKINMGVASREDYIKFKNPEMSDEDIVKKIKDIGTKAESSSIFGTVRDQAKGAISSAIRTMGDE